MLDPVLLAAISTRPSSAANPHVEGVKDRLDFCQRLVRKARLGLAPGSAFGPEGDGFLRWCFAASHERLAEGVRRLARHLKLDGGHRS